MSENERGKDEGGLRRGALVLPHFFSRSPFFPSQLPRAWNRLTHETLPSTYIIKGLKPFLLKENWLVTHLIRGPSNASICFFFRVLAQCLLSLLYVYSKNQVMLNLYNYGILHLLISNTKLKMYHQIFFHFHPTGQVSTIKVRLSLNQAKWSINHDSLSRSLALSDKAYFSSARESARVVY